MNWIAITDEEVLNSIKTESFILPQVIFKHSTTCSISSMAKNRLEKYPNINNAKFYYLDLLKFRTISNSIATLFDVHHESPQVLIILKGECIYDESHYGITVDGLLEILN